MLKVQSCSIRHRYTGEALTGQPEEDATLPTLRPVRLYLAPF